MFVLSLFVPHHPFFWCLGRAMFRDYGISSLSSFMFFFFQLQKLLIQKSKKKYI